MERTVAFRPIGFVAFSPLFAFHRAIPGVLELAGHSRHLTASAAEQKETWNALKWDKNVYFVLNVLRSRY
jgi:hypothetical protein